MNDIVAMLVIEFDASVDEVSRAMFTERMAEHGWSQQQIPNTWVLEFEPRSRTTMRDTTRRHVELACQFARFELNQLRTIAHYGEDELVIFPAAE